MEHRKLPLAGVAFDGLGDRWKRETVILANCRTVEGVFSDSQRKPPRERDWGERWLEKKRAVLGALRVWIWQLGAYRRKYLKERQETFTLKKKTLRSRGKGEMNGASQGARSTVFGAGQETNPKPEMPPEKEGTYEKKHQYERERLTSHGKADVAFRNDAKAIPPQARALPQKPH